MLVLYGSRTGNAEFIAQDISKRASEYGLLAQSMALDDVDISALAEMERVLIVCSTYGEGDMPDNAQTLWDILSEAEAPSLSQLHYSVLAFGDSSYATFCEAGKQWDKRFAELGASRIMDRTDCDVDYVDSAEQWIEAVLPLISQAGDQTTVDVTAAVFATRSTSQQSKTQSFTRDNPLHARLLEKQLLTGHGSSKEIYHYRLSLAGKELNYSPGDTINVLPTNRHSLVTELLELVNGYADEKIAGSDKTVYECLSQDMEILTPSRALLNAIADKTDDESVREILRGNDRAALDAYLWGKDIVSLLSANPGAIAFVAELFAVLRPLAPRSYSISSSLRCYPDEVHLCLLYTSPSPRDRG